MAPRRPASGKAWPFPAGRGTPPAYRAYGSPRRPILSLVLILAAMVVAIVLYLLEPTDTDLPGGIAGPVQRVVDGDTLILSGTRVRLAGIDAPELAQTCGTATGASWACGQAARQQLIALTKSDLGCRGRGYDRYGRLVAHCEVLTGQDIAAQMVEAGLALSLEGYGAEQEQARSAKRGIWQGDFEAPSTFRRDKSDPVGPAGRPSRMEQFLAWIGSLLGS